jgi:hypothetical protein
MKKLFTSMATLILTTLGLIGKLRVRWKRDATRRDAM